jgi:hypothetical protein
MDKENYLIYFDFFTPIQLHLQILFTRSIVQVVLQQSRVV